MIYKYDDIVKTTEETYSFSHVGQKDIGKAITIKEVGGYAYGGYITKITDSEITFMPMVNIAKPFVKIPTVFSAKTLYNTYGVKICIYDPSTGQHDLYDVSEFIKHSKKKSEFNTDILKPGAKFYMEANGRCGIVTVVDCGKDGLYLREEGFIGGTKYFSIDRTAYGKAITVIPNPIQLKTLDEMTCYDLAKRGFNGYGLKSSTVFEIIKILESEEVKPVE